MEGDGKLSPFVVYLKYVRKDVRYEVSIMNVNGLRAVINKGFVEFFKEIDADVFCIQETKMQEDQIDDNIKEIFKGYNTYWNSAEKKRIFRNSNYDKRQTIKRRVWNWNRRA